MPRVTIEQAVQIALQHHQAGRIAEAEKIYREVLNQRPNQADALHLLGVIALQVSRFDDAVDLISRAVELMPDLPAARNNLGVGLKSQGKLDEAIEQYQRAWS